MAQAWSGSETASHPNADLPASLAKLCDAGVEFIIVGGAACVIQGLWESSAVEMTDHFAW